MLIISLINLDKNYYHSHAHSLLRECLKKHNISYSRDTKITYGKHGKPSLADYPDIFYNISHSDGISACMIGESECGIDCEKVRSYRPKVAKRVFSEKEKALLESATGRERDLIFFRLWTLKEAYIKALGTGLSYPMNTVEFYFDGNNIITNIENFSFKQYTIRDGEFVVSLCQKKS